MKAKRANLLTAKANKKRDSLTVSKEIFYPKMADSRQHMRGSVLPAHMAGKATCSNKVRRSPDMKAIARLA